MRSRFSGAKTSQRSGPRRWAAVWRWTDSRRAALGERLDLGQPFAVAAVEEQDRGALLPPQHIAQVMAACRVQRDRRTGRQRRIHIETRNHPVAFRASIHPDPTQRDSTGPIQLAIDRAAVLN